MAEVLAASLFIAGYIAISMENKIYANKAAISLVLAALLWIIVGFTSSTSFVQEHLTEAGGDIFSLIVFLLAAMTLVEILLHYRFFDVIERRLRDKGWTYYTLSWALVGITFIFSAFLDNLTTTIVAIQIARRLFPKKHLLPVGIAVVISSNAGGAFSPIGDVTTLMLWLADRISTSGVIIQGILPSLVLAFVSSFIILRSVPKDICECNVEGNGFRPPSRSDWAIILACLGSFLIPLFVAPLGLQPYLGRLAGLGIVWIMIDFAKRARPQDTHLQAKIQRFLQHTDMESIQFLIGILLSVAALHALGILTIFATFLMGEAPSYMRTVLSFIGLGLGSAIVDNVPLTAAAISALQGVPSFLWVFLAIMVGTGGSLLVIGSAAGVIAMGMIPELTFTKYLRLGTVPALAGFVAAILVWLGQTIVF